MTHLRVTVAAAALLLTAASGIPTAVAKPVRQAPVPAQIVPVEGVANFRDAGGYRTRDGRTVRRGILYRSGTLAHATAAGQADLARLGIGQIVDLRTRSEREREPNAWLRPGRIDIWSRNYENSGGDLRTTFNNPAMRSAAGVRAMMTSAYRQMPVEQKAAYRELFARLGAGNRPLVLNCTAGKDRTGIGVALVLTALGVPYATVRQDFLLSNRAVDPARLHRSLPPALAGLPKDAIMPLAGVEGAYLDAAFAQMRRDYGSVEDYMVRELGVGPREIAQLRRRMLQ